MECSYDNMYRSAILIQGFDIDFGEVWLTFLTKRIESIFVIGDGQSSVDGGELVDSLRNVSQLSTCANQNERILIIIHAHGDIDPGGNHTVRLAKEFPMYSQVLFRLINVYFKGSVDLIFASCHGRGA